MNSKSNILILCCLFVSLSCSEAKAANMGPQLLPLPAMAQVGPAMAQEETPASLDQGEIQYLQPNISLVVDKGSADQFDFKKPPIQREIAVDVNVVKKMKIDPINQSSTSEAGNIISSTGGTELQPGSDQVPFIASTKLASKTPKLMNDTKTNGTKTNGTKPNGTSGAGSQMNSSIHLTIIIMVSACFMVQLASKIDY